MAPEQDISGAAQAAQQRGLEMDDSDLQQLKADFDAVVQRYNLAGDAMSSRVADYLTTHPPPIKTEAFAAEFGMTLRDANTMLMWIHIGTRFKSEVIDTSAERARQG